ncbi:AMP-binding protein [Leisingera sp. M523]|uniref:AMP-binding protein n=1 Tax=Leisingera sp. M523 TaxID=2867013 RepID=UPI0028831E32|nr:AMP-binding protein [Leisingera sp. M523]
MAGGIFLPLNTAYTGPEVAYFVGEASLRVVVCDPARMGKISAIADEARVLTLDAGGQGSLRNLADVQPGFDPVARKSGDLAAFLYTSGTTGRSKGAMLINGNLASTSLTLLEALPRNIMGKVQKKALREACAGLFV